MDSLRLHVPRIVADGQEIQASIISSQSAPLSQREQVPLEDVLQEDRLRSTWESVMKGADGSWQPHKEAWVLMISWADELDKMKTSDEVAKLSSVFSEKFNYGVEQGRIQDSLALPRHQVQRDLANFVCDHDGPDKLLIIYYAGHGSKGGPGTLNLTAMGNSRPKDKINERNAIPWHEVEKIVRDTVAEVLTIFDCCYAGNLCTESRSLDLIRNFEFLGATEDGTTPLPGDKSFTSALIWALEELSTSKKPFSTMELIYQINVHAPHFPKKQRPILKQRGEPSNHRLMLAPIPSGAKLEQSASGDPPLGQRLDLQKDINRSVDFRFFFKEFPTEEDIICLSRKMKGLIDKRKIPATHISWVGLFQRNLVRNAAKKWLSIIPSRTKSPLSPGATTPLAPLTPTSSQESNSNTPGGPRQKRKHDNASEDDQASPTEHKHRKNSPSI